MCLELSHETTHQLRADRDITVWKVLMRHRDRPGYESPYKPKHGPDWIPGETYHTALQPEPQYWRRPQRSHMSFRPGPVSAHDVATSITYEEVYRVDYGFHSFGSEGEAFKRATDLGLNSRMNADFCRRPNRHDYIVVRMTIPKGSHYYFDAKHNEFASEYLRFERDQSDQRINPDARAQWSI